MVRVVITSEVLNIIGCDLAIVLTITATARWIMTLPLHVLYILAAIGVVVFYCGPVAFSCVLILSHVVSYLMSVVLTIMVDTLTRALSLSPRPRIGPTARGLL